MFETDDNVDTTATENTGVEVETEQTGQETEQQTETEQPDPEKSDEEKAKQEAEQETQKKSRAQERIQKLARENAELRQFKADQEAKQNAPAQTQDEPLLEDFEDYEQWQKAVRQFDREQMKKEVLAEMGQQETKKTQNQRQAEFEVAMIELQEEGIDGSALTQKLETLPPLPVDLNAFGLNAKETLSLAAKLIENDELWYELAQMNPVQAARRIGQEIDQKPTKAAAPKIPNAPKPITPVKANAAVKRDYFEQSDDEIMKGV